MLVVFCKTCRCWFFSAVLKESASHCCQCRSWGFPFLLGKKSSRIFICLIFWQIESIINSKGKLQNKVYCWVVFGLIQFHHGGHKIHNWCIQIQIIVCRTVSWCEFHVFNRYVIAISKLIMIVLIFFPCSYLSIRSTLTITPRRPSKRTWRSLQRAVLKQPRWKSSAWWKRTPTPGSCILTFICASPGGKAQEPPCFAEGHAPVYSTREASPQLNLQPGSKQ